MGDEGFKPPIEHVVLQNGFIIHAHEAQLRVAHDGGKEKVRRCQGIIKIRAAACRPFGKGDGQFFNAGDMKILIKAARKADIAQRFGHHDTLDRNGARAGEMGIKRMGIEPQLIGTALLGCGVAGDGELIFFNDALDHRAQEALFIAEMLIKRGEGAAGALNNGRQSGVFITTFDEKRFCSLHHRQATIFTALVNKGAIRQLWSVQFFLTILTKLRTRLVVYLSQSAYARLTVM